ncbi:flagellar brake protein [Selenomonas ruminis]|nr:PilZ domain-containing protein [Selenomonas sp. mPRGC5]
MTTESKPAEAVLREGQAIHITDNAIDIHGTINEIAHRFLSISLDVSPQTFLATPLNSDELQCTVTGNGCVYRFAANFRSSSTVAEKNWFIEKPATVERIQMRRFVRVPMPLPIQVKLPGAHGSMQDTIEATLVDISGGGICFAHTNEVLLHEKIIITIPDLPLYGTLHTEARIERCTKIEVFSGTVFHIGASFEDNLDLRQQDKLIQCIFELQRSYLQKGLLLPVK